MNLPGNPTSSSPVAHLQRLQGQYQNTSVDWERLLEANYTLFLSGPRRPRGIIDIGGHAGRHAFVFRHRLGCERLDIFEPLPEQHAALVKLFSGDPTVQVHNIALSDKNGFVDFILKQSAPEESGLRQRTFYNNGRNDDLVSFKINMTRLADVTFPAPVDFIKIDTEGGEIDILRGAVELLRTHSPIVSVEYGPGGYDAYGYDAGMLFDIAGQIGYSLFDLFGNRFETKGEWVSCVGKFYWDFIMLPQARIDELEPIIRNINQLKIVDFLT